MPNTCHFDARPAIATQPMPDRTRVGDVIHSRRLCASCAAHRRERGYWIILDGETPDAAEAVQDRVLRRKHLRVAGTPALRYDRDGRRVDGREAYC